VTVPRPRANVRHWTDRCDPSAGGSRVTREVDVHAVLLAAEASAEATLPIPPAGVGLLAFGLLLTLLAVTFAFRNVGNRN